MDVDREAAGESLAWLALTVAELRTLDPLGELVWIATSTRRGAEWTLRRALRMRRW